MLLECKRIRLNAAVDKPIFFAIITFFVQFFFSGAANRRKFLGNLVS